jgi:hypothetical protein
MLCPVGRFPRVSQGEDETIHNWDSGQETSRYSLRVGPGIPSRCTALPWLLLTWPGQHTHRCRPNDLAPLYESVCRMQRSPMPQTCDLPNPCSDRAYGPGWCKVRVGWGVG